MNRPAICVRQAGPAVARGLSLIELMVAMVLAAFLGIAMVTLFLSGRTSFLTQEQVGKLQENGRYAFHVMTTELHRAGFRRETWEPPRIGFALTANTQEGSGLNPDTLELQYESDRDCLGAFNTATESIVRPDGSTVQVPQFYHKLIRFQVVDAQLVLTCGYGPVNEALAQQIDEPVANGVENLQFQYGEDLTGDFSVNQWVNAAGWNDLANIVAVRLAILVRTPDDLQIETDDRTFDLFGVTTSAADDGRIRRVYSGQVSMRNLTL